MSSSGMGRDVHSLMLFIQLTTASASPQGVLKDGFEEAVVARDMPEPCGNLHGSDQEVACANVSLQLYILSYVQVQFCLPLPRSAVLRVEILKTHLLIT